MKITHIFFDLDNTLWDTDRNSCLTLQKMYKQKQVQENYRVLFKDFFANYYQRNEELWALFRHEKVTKQDILNQRFRYTFEELGINDEEIIQYFEANFLNMIIDNNHLVPNALEILEYLNKKNYTLHIVSNGFINPTKHKIEGSPIKDYITTVTSGEEINKRKPAKEVFELGMKKANALPTESCFIGDDWDADVIGAQNTGMKAIFFNYKKESRRNGYDSVPIVDDLIELQSLFT